MQVLVLLSQKVAGPKLESGHDEPSFVKRGNSYSNSV